MKRLLNQIAPTRKDSDVSLVSNAKRYARLQESKNKKIKEKEWRRESEGAVHGMCRESQEKEARNVSRSD